MKTIHLLEAIGNIDDKLIIDAADFQIPQKRHIPIHWIRYSSIAALFLLVFIVFFGFSLIRIGSKSTASDSASEQDMDISTDVDEEAGIESEADTEAVGNLDSNGNGDLWEDHETVQGDSIQNDASEYDSDLGYSIAVQGNTYSPISFEQYNEYFGNKFEVNEPTSENTYPITEKDLGEIIGTVTFSTNENYVGLTLYHFTKYANSDEIGILDDHGAYTFFVKEN